MKFAKQVVVVLALVACAGIGVAMAQEHPTSEHPTAKEHPAPAEHPEHPTAAAHAEDGVLAKAAADGRFTRFIAAVEAAGLTRKLQGEGPFTIFAPTDEAFATLPKGMLDDLMAPANQARLAGLLACHVVPGELRADKMKTMKATNVDGQDLDIEVAGKQLTVDGAHVLGAELVAANGVIHAIDAVLVPEIPIADPENAKPKDHPVH